MKKIAALLSLLVALSCCVPKDEPISFGKNDLVYTSLAKTWDEGIPLGNGIIGALIWQKQGKLRMSLDNVNLWDLRPMENLNTPDYKFSWVYEQWKNNNYGAVQGKFDAPYNYLPAPSKIPGAALEFAIEALGPVASTRLSIHDAVSLVKWENGAELRSFVHATDQTGWFKFKGVPKNFKPVLIPPTYNLEGEVGAESPVTGQDLRRLKYPKGSITKDEKHITYIQQGWGGFNYLADVSWTQKGDVLEGCWSITADFPGWAKKADASALVQQKIKDGYNQSFKTHKKWWKQFWEKSSISIPDSVLEKQWYMEQYKFGAAARDGAPPISLQAVWTADNGKLPPWKGDYHHDLNTQLSYWPAYSGNHLDLENGYLEWLLKYKATFKKYTRDYYESDGLAVPGVTTLTGEPMGGWIQYAFGPTVSGWLSQHFYLHWRYTMDKEFLKEKAYPWIKEVAVFFEEISVKNSAGMRKLPISASPETHDNSRAAWFSETTNFDLAAIRWTYEKAQELALVLGNKEEAQRWENALKEWPYFAIDENEGLMLAPGHPYAVSHRHFSHLLSFYPLGLIDYAKGDEHKTIIDNTIKNLLSKGSGWWTGYSFSWLGNLQARAFDGEAAAKTLRIFSENFCLPNSFHVNGEQHNKGLSNFKYRPFTLEGNFAFASAIQEMLIQSHSGTVHVFPAIPEAWKNVSFDKLRAEGAFLLSAKKENGAISSINVYAEKGGLLKLKNPFGSSNLKIDAEFKVENGIITIETEPNQQIVIKSFK